MQRRKINQIECLNMILKERERDRQPTKAKAIFSHQGFVDKYYSNRCDYIKHPWGQIKSTFPIRKLCWSHFFLHLGIRCRYFHCSAFMKPTITLEYQKAIPLSAWWNKLSNKVRIQMTLFASNKHNWYQYIHINKFFDYKL